MGGRWEFCPSESTEPRKESEERAKLTPIQAYIFVVGHRVSIRALVSIAVKDAAGNGRPIPSYI
jgi:hypothetical protein